MQYKIVRQEYSMIMSELDIKIFEKTVNDFCEKGWKAIGGVVIINDTGYKYLLQTMVKEDEEDKYDPTKDFYHSQQQEYGSKPDAII